jgi:hypothetical protein
MINRCTHSLARLLEPMVLLGAGAHGNAEAKRSTDLENALFEICSSALKLALRFRASKTMYEFKAYEDDTCLAVCDENLIDPQATEREVSEPLDKSKLFLFCTLFGALVKTRRPVDGGASESVVLEKGHIIIYEPQQRSNPRNAHKTA